MKKLSKYIFGSLSFEVSATIMSQSLSAFFLLHDIFLCYLCREIMLWSYRYHCIRGCNSVVECSLCMREDRSSILRSSIFIIYHYFSSTWNQWITFTEVKPTSWQYYASNLIEHSAINWIEKYFTASCLIFNLHSRSFVNHLNQ